MADETEQILDIETLKMVDVPKEKPAPAPKSEEKEKEEEEKEEEDKTDKSNKSDSTDDDGEEEGDGKDKSAKKADEEVEEEEEESEEEDEGKADEGKEKSTADKPKKEDQTEDQFVEKTYGEKYGIKTQVDLDKLINNAIEQMDDHESLTKKVAELEKAEPKFGSDDEKNAYEFIKKYGIPEQGEALLTYAKLIAMDPEKTDGKLLLEEEYVFKHPELTRDEALKRYSREYNRKYNPKKEDFDTEEEWKEEIDMTKIDLKSDIAKAKKFFNEERIKYKPAAKDDKPKVNESVQKSIEKNAPEYAEFVDKQENLTFEKNGEKYTFALDKDRKQKLSKAVAAWVNNPSSYDDKGQLVGVKDAKTMTRQLAGLLFLEDITVAIIDQAHSKVNIKRIDEVAKKKPEKRDAPVGDGKVKSGKDELYEGARRLIKSRG